MCQEVPRQGLREDVRAVIYGVHSRWEQLLHPGPYWEAQSCCPVQVPPEPLYTDSDCLALRGWADSTQTGCFPSFLLPGERQGMWQSGNPFTHPHRLCSYLPCLLSGKSPAPPARPCRVWTALWAGNKEAAQAVECEMKDEDLAPEP